MSTTIKFDDEEEKIEHEFFDENDKKLDINILFPFLLPKYNNTYIAYTVNDDGVSENVEVFISKIVYAKNRVVVSKMSESEQKDVLKEYNRLIKELNIDNGGD